MAETLVGEGDNGGTVSAKAGDSLVVRLPENPTTGYRWSTAGAEPRLLQPQSDDFTPGAGVGGGGMRIFRYRATDAGETSVRFLLTRPWEGTAPRSQFTIQVSISP